MTIVSKESRKELIEAVRHRYRNSTKLEKGRILDEFTALSGVHRKHAIRIMKQARADKTPATRGNARIYHEAVKEVLIVLWEASDRICGKRLVAIIPALLEAMERHGHLDLNEEVRKKVLSVSASSVDRMLSPVRKSAGIRRRKKSSRKASKAIKIKTSHDWKDSTPGFLEIDFVVHGGGSTAGEILHSLVATDVCSGWTEAIALISREQTLVVEGLKQIQEQMPVPVLGINSDNDSAFINDTLIEFCREAGITFTRSRVHHKNDQAWVEQKNGAIIRKIVGHKRFSGLVAGQIMATLFQAVRLYVNIFQPSFKLRERTRDGSKVKKHYHPPASPCERLLEREDVSESAKVTLRAKSVELDPVELLRQIRNGQTALAALNGGEVGDPGSRKSLNEFLSEFPDLWKQGEVRATHRKSISKDRHWRTREDPFKDAWADILLWLQEDPDITAKTVLKRLQAENPALYQESMLRTLQRRVGEWRRSMARNLILGGTEKVENVGPVTG